ncbi:MAG: hypothetical protein II712_05445, partial [Erysipelotrichaceae bacterium]|nr:hypothetical protein [Erysipelotrichaceae bacterium]
MNRKYLTVIACCCLFIGACLGTSNALGAFIIPLAQQTNSLRGTVSLASTIYGIISGFFAPLLIKCLRKYPLKYILLLSGLLTALLTCSFGFMYDVRIYLLANVFKGFLNAFFNSTVIVIIIGNWFRDLKSTITALVLGFSGIAGAFFSPLFSSIIVKFGLKAGYFTQAFFLLTLTPEEQNMTPYENALKKRENGIRSEETVFHRFSVKDP